MNLFRKIKMSAIIAGMMICFAAPAYGADLKLNVDALIRARDAEYNYITEKPSDVFEGVQGNITYTDIYNCLKKYGEPERYFFEQDGPGFIMDNLEILILLPDFSIGEQWNAWGNSYLNQRYDEIIITPSCEINLGLLKHKVFDKTEDLTLQDQMIEKVSYLNHGGKIEHTTGWKQEQIGDYLCWTYYDSNGNKVIGWREIDGNWYYFKEDGSLVHSKLEYIGGFTYYFAESGAMQTGWHQIHYNGYDSWFFFDIKGHMVTGGPYNIDGKVYHFEKDGTMTWGSTALSEDGALRYYKEDGDMLYGALEGTKVIDRIDQKEYIVKGGVARPAMLSFSDKVAQFEKLFPISEGYSLYWQHKIESNLPEGYPYTYTETPDYHSNHRYSGSCGCNSFNQSISCTGFAKMFFNYVFGYDPTSKNNKITDISDIKTGDYVSFGSHEVFVTGVYQGSDGKTHWSVARESWGSGRQQWAARILCSDYVVDGKTVTGTELYPLHMTSQYTFEFGRRADAESRKALGLTD